MKFYKRQAVCAELQQYCHLAKIEWMKEEYGDQIEYRIDVVNAYHEA